MNFLTAFGLCSLAYLAVALSVFVYLYVTERQKDAWLFGMLALVWLLLLAFSIIEYGTEILSFHRRNKKGRHHVHK